MTNTLVSSSMQESVDHALDNAKQFKTPFCYWEIEGVFPASLTENILAIHLDPPDASLYDGTRALDSKIHPHPVCTTPKRMFITPNIVKQYPFFEELISVFLSPMTLEVVQKRFNLDAKGLYLRIEYINDFDGFFLEPHKDIVEKKLSLFVYLGEGPRHMGTDLYDSNLNVVKTIAFKHNQGYIFVPGDNTWHGLERKPIPDRRCSLLVNYVTFKTDWPVI